MSGSPESPSSRRAVPWSVISLLVVILGVVGFATVTFAGSSVQHTIGEAMLTVALVSGPFLWAEALLTQPTRRRHREETIGADLAGRDLTGADLTGRYLRRREMSAVRLSEADLGRADLTEAHLDDARLTRTNLAGALLSRSSLKSAACFRADLRGADLTEADLRWANLKKADLRGSCLVDADLRNADLRGTDLRDTDLRGASLTGARYSRSTRFTEPLDQAGELARLGMIRHADEPAGEDPSPLRRWTTFRPALRIGALAAVVAALTLAIPAILPDDPGAEAHVEGASQDRPYYRVSGDAAEASVRYLGRDGRFTELVSDLPVSLPASEDTTILSIEAHSLDRGGVRCQIHHGGQVVSQAESNGTASAAECAFERGD
ncbi:MAG: pentapeptide repeat-containing protein [Acidimicrobiia bacterium]|nr:pentapeptide repeat-containing protein [Acidimicrobiia bacterium]